MPQLYIWEEEAPHWLVYLDPVLGCDPCLEFCPAPLCSQLKSRFFMVLPLFFSSSRLQGIEAVMFFFVGFFPFRSLFLQSTIPRFELPPFSPPSQPSMYSLHSLPSLPHIHLVRYAIKRLPFFLYSILHPFIPPRPSILSIYHPVQSPYSLFIIIFFPFCSTFISS